MVVVGGISLMEKLKIIGPSKDPCGIPFEKSPSPLTDCVPGRMERLTESNAFDSVKLPPKQQHSIGCYFLQTDAGGGSRLFIRHKGNRHLVDASYDMTNI